MTEKIASLTPAQEVILAQVREEWLAHGLSTEPADRPAAEAGVRRAYEIAGLSPPATVVWCDSPMAGAAEVRRRSSSAGTTFQWTYGLNYGLHDAGYCAWLDAMRRIGVRNLEPYLEGNGLIAKSAGWWWSFDSLAVLTERPCELLRDAQGRLHSASGQAVVYPDGWGFFSWHGRPVPSWVVENPSMENITAEPNTEVRRCAIESTGWDRFTVEAGLRLVGDSPDPGNPGQRLSLYDVPSKLWGGNIRLLLAVNGSTERDGTRRRYGLTVPAQVTDPVEAAAWTARLTKEEYAQMQRRT